MPADRPASNDPRASRTGGPPGEGGDDAQTPPATPPEQRQTLGEDAETTSQTVSTPEPEEPRLGEAGNAYVGRQMDDDLKANPRVEDARDVEGDDEAAA